jgi:hypothetical protein
MPERPAVAAVSNRALVLYAFVRRGAIELLVNESDGDPGRIAQGEAARRETDRWLERESLLPEVTDVESRLFDARVGAWPAEAIRDALWRKEPLGVLLWTLEHLTDLPGYDREFDQHELDAAITRYGSVSSFRDEGTLRSEAEVDAAWMEADAWFAATEGRTGEDAALASLAAERLRALTWLRDASAPTP